MRRWLTGIVAALIVLAFVPRASRSQDASPVGQVYILSDSAAYRSGCFGPCLCPILLAPVRGTLQLTPTGFDGLFNSFDVSDVTWAVNVGGSELLVRGSGTYKRGGEVALLQQLELDLAIADNPVQHFDSGLVPAGMVEFPSISVVVSMNHMSCHDTVIIVDATPTASDPANVPALDARTLSSLILLIVAIGFVAKARAAH